MSFLNAIERNDIQSVKEMIGFGIDVNNWTNHIGQTYLMMAIGKPKILQLLIDAGADLDVKDLHGRTAISWASYHGCDKSVQTLIPAGAALDIQDNFGDTALILSLKRDQRDDYIKNIPALLVSGGAALDIQNSFGMTALHYAAFNCYKDAVRLLLDAGATANVFDKKLKTPLMELVTTDAQYGPYSEYGVHFDIANLLIKAGSDVMLKNAKGNTALDLAIQKSRRDLETLLKHEAEKRQNDFICQDLNI